MNLIEPKRIFIDTSAWIEYALENEKYHEEVYKYLKSEVKKGSKIFTSEYVLDETFTRLITLKNFRIVKQFKIKFTRLEKNEQLVLLWVDEALFNKAWHFFNKFSEHKLSFTDATIYTFVKDLKIDEVLTLDRGFKKVGLKTKPDL